MFYYKLLYPEHASFMEHKTAFKPVLEELTAVHYKKVIKEVILTPGEKDCIMAKIVTTKPSQMTPSEMDLFVQECLPDRITIDDNMERFISFINQKVLSLNSTLYDVTKETCGANHRKLFIKNENGDSLLGSIFGSASDSVNLSGLENQYQFINKAAEFFNLVDVGYLTTLLNYSEINEIVLVIALAHPFCNGVGEPLFLSLHPQYFCPGSGKTIIKALIAKIEENAASASSLSKSFDSKWNNSFKGSYPWQSIAATSFMGFGGLFYYYLHSKGMTLDGFMVSGFLSYCVEKVKNVVDLLMPLLEYLKGK